MNKMFLIFFLRGKNEIN